LHERLPPESRSPNAVGRRSKFSAKTLHAATTAQPASQLLCRQFTGIGRLIQRIPPCGLSYSSSRADITIRIACPDNLLVWPKGCTLCRKHYPSESSRS